MSPKRIQRRRMRGWTMPPNTVSVTRPGRSGNPYRVGVDAPDAEGAVRLFRLQLEVQLLEDPGMLEPLRGKDLACWCKIGEPCHGDILLAYANKETV